MVKSAEDFRKEAQDRHERKCFGCTIEALREGTFITNWEKPQDLLMLSMSIQSDVQELLERNRVEDDSLRQYLNRSKYVLSEVSRLLNKRAEDDDKAMRDDPRIKP